MFAGLDGKCKLQGNMFSLVFPRSLETILKQKGGSQGGGDFWAE